MPPEVQVADGAQRASLRFALLMHGSRLDPWQLRCVDLLAQAAELAGIFAAGEPPPSPSATGAILTRLWARSLRRSRAADIAARFPHVPRLTPDPDGRRLKDIGKLDFVLQLGGGPIPPGIERQSRLGVWRFEHELRGDRLPFFQEVSDGADVTEAALLAFGPGEGEALILEQGWFSTAGRSYGENLERVLDTITEWPARVCRLLARTGRLCVSGTAATRGPRGEPPSRPHLLRYAARIASRRLGKAWQRLFRQSQWNIGVLNVSAGALLEPGAYRDSDIEWFPLADRKKFLADPFGLVRGGKIHVLCEEFTYRSGKGRICALHYSGNRFSSETACALDLPFHMSYPFLVEAEGETYCVPEICQADEVALYQAVGFPHSWRKAAVLVENFGGVDPTVFRHDDRWWLMCTERGRHQDTRLWVWHASALHGPWIPHAGNPVKTDVRSARPGGVPFVHNGVLYRPAQDCSRTYGGRIVILRVTALTPTEFCEEEVTAIEPSPASPFPSGRHTLTAVGDLVLIDGHREVFIWDGCRAFLGICARDLSRKLWRRPRELAPAVE